MEQSDLGLHSLIWVCTVCLCSIPIFRLQEYVVTFRWCNSHFLRITKEGGAYRPDSNFQNLEVKSPVSKLLLRVCTGLYNLNSRILQRKFHRPYYKWNSWILQCNIAFKRCRQNNRQSRHWSDCSLRSSLIWVCTVCSDLSVPIFQIITVIVNMKT